MRSIVACLILGFLTGCSTTGEVRYVYQDGDFGVIGLPENTDQWPTHYRRKADELMNKHFPEGHEVIRAEEVVEGERTLKTEGSNTAEVMPQLPAELLKVARIGHSESRSQSDTLKLKECRIVYHRIGTTAKGNGYASAAELNPTQYIDPNAAERKKPAAEPEKKPKQANEG